MSVFFSVLSIRVIHSTEGVGFTGKKQCIKLGSYKKKKNFYWIKYVNFTYTTVQKFGVSYFFIQQRNIELIKIDSKIIGTNLWYIYISNSAVKSICVCVHIYVCVYIQTFMLDRIINFKISCSFDISI